MDLLLIFIGLFCGSSCCLGGSKISFLDVGLFFYLLGRKEEEVGVKEKVE